VDKIGGLDAAIKEAAVLGKKKNIQHKIIRIQDVKSSCRLPFAQSKFHQTRKLYYYKDYNLLQGI
jgi:hypothetical protein